MKKIGCIIFFSFLMLFSEPGSVLGQKSLPLDEQSQQVQRSGDVVQITTQTNTGDDAQPVQAESATESATTSASPERSRNSTGTPSAIIIPDNGFAPSITVYINWLLSAVMVVAILLVFSQFIIAGFEWITSGGDKSKTDSARQRIIHTFIGVLVLSASYAIVQFVTYILGFGSLNDALLSLDRIGG